MTYPQLIQWTLAWLTLGGAIGEALGADHRNSICLVQCPIQPDGSNSTGSGVLVEHEGRRFVLTNAHVVRQGSGAFREVTVTFTESGRRARLKFVDGLPDHEGPDVVAYAADDLTDLPAVTLAETPAEPTHYQGVATVYGHPLAGRMRVRRIRYWLSSRESYYTQPNGARGPPVQFEGGAISGESGGPVINDQGQLVAVVWGGADNVARCVPLQPIRRLLRRIFTAQAYCPPGGCGGGGVVVQSRPVYRPSPQYQPQVRQPSREVEVTGPLEPVRRSPDSRVAGCECGDLKERVAGLGDRLDQLEQSLGGLPGDLQRIRDELDRTIAASTKTATAVGEVNVTLARLETAVNQVVGGDDELSGRLGALESRLDEWQSAEPSPLYFAVVADQGAEYWPRLRDEYGRAAEVYQGLRLAPPPENGAGRLPRLVAFRDGTPIGNVGGSREVSEALNQLARGQTPRFF